MQSKTVPPASADTRPRLAGLDFLRGFAALWVLMFHVVELVPAAYHGPYSPYLLHVGWNGVDLFFVLSGFLIGGLLAADRGETRGGFLLRRVLRIYPAFLVVAVACLLGTRPHLLEEPWVLVSHLFMVHNLVPGHGGAINGVLWTLGSEFQFYLLAALLLGLVRGPRAWWTLTLAMLGISLASRYAVFHLWQEPGQRFFLGTQLPGMLGLFAAGFAVVKLRPLCRAAIEAHFALCAASAALLLVLYLGWLRGHIGDYWDVEVPVVWGRFFTAVVFGYLVLVFACVPPAVGRFFQRSGWVYLGEISYGVYLVHLPVMETMATWAPRYLPGLTWYGYLGLLLAVVGLLATALHVVVERPFIALGRRLSSRARPAPAAPARPTLRPGLD
ncbi:acyltransferase family protein [Pseudomonas mangiferae]|uniref:Acyltransferase n=1 Tax=Pseudomonas mangiferae TaxID=2593654 RepID=A0A553GWJ3_9PSED|nr:acyltransferase [Pseudomonas mangiferae]TRX73884.1 acyltransferase [Pseudomonas mangiferae]